MASNLSSVLFTLSLVYTYILWLAVVRTYKIMCYKGPQSEHHRVFKVFYAFIYTTLLLTIVLYCILSTHLYTLTDDFKGNFALIAFYFLPTIFLVLVYSLMYYQLEMLMTKSKINAG